MSFGQHMDRLWRRLSFRKRRAELYEELGEELDFHLAKKREAFARAGFPPETAEELSRREVGNLAVAKEGCRDMWSFMRLEQLFQDLRYAVRMYARTPLFTSISVLSLALGIGGNVAMFSLVNALLIRPLPYPQAQRLERITGIYPRAAVPFFQQRSRAMEVAAVSVGNECHLVSKGIPSRVTGSSASPNFLAVLGASVERGRAFEAGEEAPGRDRVALINHALWMEQWGGDPAVVGRIVRLDGMEREIVGVMPASFDYPSAKVQMWIPMRLDPANFSEYWGTEFVPLIGRLKASATVAEARSEIRSLTSQFRATFPYPMARDWNADSTAIPLQQDIVGDVRGKLVILLSTVALVLLIACANVASLLLSRATARRKELALRAALGAGKFRIIRQLLTESVGLSIAGAALGSLLGAVGLRMFKNLFPASLPGLGQAHIDASIVGAVALMAILTGIAAGLAPALSASQVSVTETIKTGSQRSTSGFWTRFRSVIIACEVALTLVLLVSAGLLLRSLYKLSEAAPGFAANRVLTVEIGRSDASCAQRAECIAFYDRLLERARGVTGVSAAAVANAVPLDGQSPAIPVDLEGHPKTAGHPAPMLWMEAVSPDYLTMLRIPLIGGRLLTRSDGPDAPAAVVISAATAKRFWPGENAVGKHIKPTLSANWSTVVGVVGDVRQATLSNPLPAWMAGEIYVPYAQAVREDGKIPAAMTLLVRAESDRARATAELQRVAAAQDSTVPVGRVTPLVDVVSRSIGDFRSTMRVFLGFACAAMFLAGIGIYGLMSYWVSQRTYEIGLRVAIGATRGRVVKMILAEGLRVSAYGILGGVAAALVLTRFLAAMLYGVGTTDLETFAAVTILVLAVGVLATALPAWRATRIDPVKSLRAE